MTARLTIRWPDSQYDRAMLGRIAGLWSYSESRPLGRIAGWSYDEVVVKRGTTVIHISSFRGLEN